MSSDNGVYILETKDSFRQERTENFIVSKPLEEPIQAYRVAECAGEVDNLSYARDQELYLLGLYMHLSFGESEVFYDRMEALAKADSISKEILEEGRFLEYGIAFLNFNQFSFPC